MSSLSNHLKKLKYKNPWYAENYGLKHVITVVNYRAVFEQLGIKVIEERFHTQHPSAMRLVMEHEECICWYGICDHFHYIIDVPMNILVKAYEQKQNWAKILGIHHDIIYTRQMGLFIQKQLNYEILMKFFLSSYPREEISDETYIEKNYSKYETCFKWSLNLKETEKDREIKRKMRLEKISKTKGHRKRLKETLNEKKAQEAEQIRHEAKLYNIRREFINTTELAKLYNKRREFLNTTDTTTDDIVNNENFLNDFEDSFEDYLLKTSLKGNES